MLTTDFPRGNIKFPQSTIVCSPFNVIRPGIVSSAEVGVDEFPKERYQIPAESSVGYVFKLHWAVLVSSVRVGVDVSETDGPIML